MSTIVTSTFEHNYVTAILSAIQLHMLYFTTHMCVAGNPIAGSLKWKHLIAPPSSLPVHCHEFSRISSSIHGNF